MILMLAMMKLHEIDVKKIAIGVGTILFVVAGYAIYGISPLIKIYISKKEQDA